MTVSVEDLLAEASRCVLGSWGQHGPMVTPAVFWSDGMGLWTTTSTARVSAAGLDTGRAAVAYVPPLRVGEAGVIARGRVRVYRLGDPRGLVLHTPTISAAMTALAVRNADAVLGQVRDAVRIPPHLPRARAVLRLTVEDERTVVPPDVGPGVAPALPTDVPAEVRRALAGQRRLVLVYADPGEAVLQAAPAVWGAGYALTTPPSLRPATGARAVAAVDVDPGSRPSRAFGLAVHGVIAPDGRLEPERATSWSGYHTETVTISAPAPGGVTLPD